ncbi:MAG: hypothetical protein GY854_30870 [Deltaproteobacteria bacterium]|nr:hypothetical protein [Deltaproteobacteria bacterium]
MMEHLDKIRLMELALDESVAPSTAEASHLETCSLCAQSLTAEMHLTEALGAIAHRPVPNGFTERVTCQFKSMTRVRIAPFLAVSGTVAAALAFVMIRLIFENPSDVISSGAVLAGRVAGLIRACYVILDRVPMAGEIVTITSAAMVLLCTGLLAGLVKKSATVK